jgi:transcriptional adapter 3
VQSILLLFQCDCSNFFPFDHAGILDADDGKSDDDPSDQVLSELKKKQQELRVLSQHNLMVTKRLYKMAKEEIQRQELRRKMATADADVCYHI